MRRLLLAAIAMVVSHACLADEGASRAVITDSIYTAPVRLIDIGDGQRLNLYCLGSGSPAVIFDAGMGGSTISWALVQRAVSNKTMACSFDRAGLGFSDAARRPSTPRNQSEDLHALLKAAHINPPYVLAGHSMAGMNVRVYADQYPDQVAGMVLVEGSHEDQSILGWAIGETGQKERYDAYLKDSRACVAEAEKGLVEGTETFKKCVGNPGDPLFSPAINEAQKKRAVTVKWQAAVASERENVFYQSAAETRASRKDFGDMPLMVLTHSPYPKGKDETQEIRDRRTLLWEGLHTQVASMSTRGINIVVPNSGHFIQYDHPQIVVDTVLQAVNIARGNEWGVGFRAEAASGGVHSDGNRESERGLEGLLRLSPVDHRQTRGEHEHGNALGAGGNTGARGCRVFEEAGSRADACRWRNGESRSQACL